MSGIINKTPDMRSGVVGVWDHNDFYKLKAYSPSFGAWSATLGTTHLNKHYPYEVSDGTWRVRFNIIMSVTSAGATVIFEDLGHVFATVAGHKQDISGHSGTNGTILHCYVESGGNKIYMSGGTGTVWAFSGDVLLDSKPTYV